MFLILVFSFYFLGFFEQGKVVCLPHNHNRRPELLRLVVGDISVLYSHTLVESEVRLMLELYRENFIQAQLNNTTNHQSFSISRFLRKDNTYFTINSPYNHYNISLELYKNWQWNAGAYHQLTTYKNYLIKPISGFNFFDGTNLHLKYGSQQLISDELRFYDFNILKPIENKDMIEQIRDFNYYNQKKLIIHFKRSLHLDLS